MVFDLLEISRVVLALGGTGVAAYFDITNNRNIPNEVSYSFVALALLINFANFDLNSFIFTAGVALALFIIGYVFYRMGQIGGADILVLCAIALAIPLQPSLSLFVSGKAPFLMPFQIPFVFSVIIAASLSFSVAMLFKNVPRALLDFSSGKVKIGPLRYLSALFIFAAYGCFVFLASQLPLFPPLYIILITFVMASSLFFMLFKDYIQDSMIEEIPVSRMQEEDVLAIEKMDKKIIEKYKLRKLLTLSEIARLKKLPIKKFPVYTKMPMFLPYVLIGLAVSLIFGDLLLLFSGL